MKARPHRACLKAFLWRHSRACCGACPVAILTDGDAANIGGAPSATAIALEAKEAEIPNLHVEYSAITFEHELARSAAILPLMLDAFGTLHPINGASLKAKVNALATGDAILLEDVNHLFIEWHGSLVSTFANHMNRLFLPVDVLFGQPSTFTRSDVGCGASTPARE